MMRAFVFVLAVTLLSGCAATAQQQPAPTPIQEQRPVIVQQRPTSTTTNTQQRLNDVDAQLRAARDKIPDKDAKK